MTTDANGTVALEFPTEAVDLEVSAPGFEPVYGTAGVDVDNASEDCAATPGARSPPNEQPVTAPTTAAEPTTEAAPTDRGHARTGDIAHRRRPLSRLRIARWQAATARTIGGTSSTRTANRSGMPRFCPASDFVAHRRRRNLPARQCTGWTVTYESGLRAMPIRTVPSARDRELSSWNARTSRRSISPAPT